MEKISATSGAMDCYLAAPNADKPCPLIIMFMDVWGMREELFAMARRVAAEGYCCVLPDLYHRHGRLVFEQRTPDGRTASFDDLPLEMQRHMKTYSRQVVRATIAEDVEAIFAVATSWPVAPGKAGAVGFCMGGRAALYAGQVFAERIRAVACLHGTVLLTDDESISAHTQIDRMQGEVYCGFGELDQHAPPTIARDIERRFKNNSQVAYSASVHAGAQHGYTMPDRNVYNHVAAENDWTAIFEMFRRQLDH